MTLKANSNIEQLGRIVQNESSPLVMCSSGTRLFAYIDEGSKDSIGDSSYVVAADNDSEMKILCRVKKIESYPKEVVIVKNRTSEFVTKVELEPLGQLDEKGVQTLPNANFNDFIIRNVRSEELVTIFSIPNKGLSCGTLITDNNGNNIPYRIPPELLYRSLFICGAKGSGKTSCLRYLLPEFLKGSGEEYGRQCVVILDIEGEFSSPHVQSLFRSVGASVNLHRVSTDLEISTSTLGLSQVHFEHLVYFAPNLQLNSVIALESIYKQLVSTYADKKVSKKAPEVLKDIREAAWRQPNIHHSQREAIIRATMSDIFHLFDQNDKTTLLANELVKPGQVSIIDVSTLTDDQQRTVALYLLSIFSGYKNQSQDFTGLLLVMDEAQKLFPQRGDLKQEYAQRLSKFVDHIVHRGRRRRYGVVLSTQYPADVSRQVVELCDTKFIFKMSGPMEWLRTNLGGLDYARTTSSLRVGESFLVSNGLGSKEPVRVQFPYVPTIRSSMEEQRSELKQTQLDISQLGGVMPKRLKT